MNNQRTIRAWTNNLLVRSWRFNRLLALAAILHVLIIPFLLLAMIVDPKVITGANAWIKPLKFALSGAIYGFTFGWLLTYIKGDGKWRKRWVQVAANITGAVLIIETLLITVQVVRGIPSHFNVSTPLDATIFSIMGAAIFLLSLMNLVALIFLTFQRMDNRVFAWSIKLGLVATLIGMGTGFLMTAGPTPEQMALVEATGEMPTVGAHSVGVADGGAGLPFIGWSTEGGDLRAPHFFGLHAMQLIPLLGWLLTRPTARRRWADGNRLLLVFTGGLAYTGVVVLLTWQALRGQSIIAPDSATLLAFGLLAGATLVVATVALRTPRQPGDAHDSLTATS